MKDHTNKMPFKLKKLIAIMEDRFWASLLYNIRREEAARQLGDLGDKRAVQPLLKILESPRNYYNYDLWWAAIESLGKLRDIRAVQPLVSILSKDSYSETRAMKERMHAARALVSIHDQVADSVIELLQGEYNLFSLEPAAFVLGEIKDQRAVPVLTAIVRKEDYEGRIIPVAHALMKISGDDIPPDVRHKIQKSEKKRVESAKKWTEESERRERIDSLIRAISAHRDNTKVELELIDIGTDVIDPLISALKNQCKPSQREMASIVHILRRLKAKKALDMCTQLLLDEHNEWALRAECACALGEFGSRESAQPLAFVYHRLKSHGPLDSARWQYDSGHHQSILLEVIMALGKIKGELAYTTLLEATNDRDFMVAGFAKDAIKTCQGK